MADTFEIKQHDRRPFFVVNLTDENGVVNLTTAGTAYFNMGTSSGGTLGGAVITRGVASVSNAATGEVTYQWGTADTSSIGNFLAEVAIIWNDGKQETYPGGPSTGSYWQVLITKDIDNSWSAGRYPEDHPLEIAARKAQYERALAQFPLEPEPAVEQPQVSESQPPVVVQPIRARQPAPKPKRWE